MGRVHRDDAPFFYALKHKVRDNTLLFFCLPLSCNLNYLYYEEDFVFVGDAAFV